MKASNNQLIRMMQQQFYEEMRAEFLSLGNGGHYTNLQKEYAFRTIQEYGIRATSRILSVPRRTLQRWCRLYNVYVKRCPAWVYEWAERRLFKPDDYEDKMQLLGRLIGEELGVEFVNCRYVGEKLAFKGVFRYKGGYTEATLATRKELEDKMPGKEIENTKEEIRQWKLQVNKNDG